MRKRLKQNPNPDQADLMEILCKDLKTNPIVTTEKYKTEFKEALRKYGKDFMKIWEYTGYVKSYKLTC